MRALIFLLGLLLLPVLACAQPALDGHGTGSATSGTTVTVAATTAANPEIVIVHGVVRSANTTNPSLTISGCSLTWNTLGTPAQFNNSVPVGTAIFTWYAQTSSNLSACTITVTSSVTQQAAAIAYCSFSGINASNAFDPHSGLPNTLTNASASSQTEQIPLSTTLAHDTMVTTNGQVTTNQGGLGPSTGATTCANLTAGGLNFVNTYIIYKTFTAPQTNFSIGMNTNATWFSVVGTALTADAPAGHSRLIQ